MTEPTNGNRITVSEDKLDAKLAKLELNLVDRITAALDAKADRAFVEQIQARLRVAEGTLQSTSDLLPSFKNTADDVEKRLRRLERFRYAIPSAAVVSAIAAACIALFTHLP